MELWALITVAAAFLQNLRSAAQARLKGRLTADGAVFVRFGYGAPVALIYAAALAAFVEPLPAPTLGWAAAMSLAALAQIAGTYTLLASFEGGGFALGTAFSKIEPLLAAVAGAVILSETPSMAVSAAILIGVAGVAIAALGKGGLRRRPPLGSLGYGVATAALLGASAVGYRAASLSLEDGGFLVRAGLTLAAATLFQAVVMAAALAVLRPGALRGVAPAWRPGFVAGVAGAAASGCWFTAFTLEPAAHVRALGQIELLFTVLAAMFVFGERPARAEIAGVALLAAGVVLLLLSV